MKKTPEYVSSFRDRHGKVRYRFRRKGYPSHDCKAPFGKKDFEREYAALFNAEKPAIDKGRIRPGTVSDVIARYYSDTAFLDLRPTTQQVYRGFLERFRGKCGDEGRIRLRQSKTSNTVDVPIVILLQEALDAGPIGKVLVLENNRGTAFTAKGFYNMVKLPASQQVFRIAPHTGSARPLLSGSETRTAPTRKAWPS
ncbi:MAG: hypothetical protein AAGI28_07605 [Pseudomonadota bacterium]